MRPEAAGPAGPGLAVEWAAPARVGAFMSTREGGRSLGPWAGWNLGDHVGDDAQAVADHRAAFARVLGARPAWLRQVHGVRVVDAARATSGAEPADAAFAVEPGVACTVQVADCLPVLLAAANGRAVGAAHAGWRGLAGGVVEAAVQAVAEAAGCGPSGLHAWLGPCIGPRHFEVGADVVEAFRGGEHFQPRAHPDGRPRWLADLPALARARLTDAGVAQVSGGQWCTVSEPARFYSYRRDGATGRMAAAVWLRH
jgi:YfiH family protein